MHHLFQLGIRIPGKKKKKFLLQDRETKYKLFVSEIFFINNNFFIRNIFLTILDVLIIS